MTFFSEKGGVGKSTFSIMYAGWLHHKHGVKVAVADFNDRIGGYRRSEIRIRNTFLQSHPESQLKPNDEKLTWPIVECKQSEIREIRRNGSAIPYAAWFENEIGEDGRLKDFDVVLFDFPGNLSGGEFNQLLNTQKIGGIVIPTEKDEMTLQSTMKLAMAIKQIKETTQKELRYSLFVTKAELGLRNLRGQYFNLAKRLTEMGYPVLPDLISRSERISALDKVDSIRSTFTYPDFDAPEFGKPKDLGFENLFIDVTRELAKSKEIKGTAKTDLSFVEKLTKHDDGRQFSGSAFLDYEIIAE